MLTAIELENFKAFGEKTHIRFAPITLIFGQNSAGKSAILQSLHLLKQTLENPESGAVLLPRVDNGFVDTGSFKELIFDHDLSRKFSIKINTDLYLSSHLGCFGLEFSFKRPDQKSELSIDSIDLYTTKPDIKIASFKPIKITKNLRSQFSMDLLRSRRASRDVFGAVRCSHISKSPELWSNYFENAKNMAEKIEKTLSFSLKENEIRGSLRRFPDRGYSNEDLQQAINFYASDFDLDSYIARMVDSQKGTIFGLNGFLPFLYSIESENRTLPELELQSQPRTSPAGGNRDQVNFISISDWILRASRVIEDTLGAIFPMGPFRRPPERWYNFPGTTPNSVGYNGDLLPDLLFRKADLLKEANNWLDRLDIGYQLNVTPLSEKMQDLFEVRLTDRRRNGQIDVSLSDVGFGISQILPFIVQSLASSEQIISIEQPEVHIHPRLQADLGDLLIETIQEPRNNRFIIETHSEHLILRLLRRIRETASNTLREGTAPLKPDQVSILYVQRGENGSEVVHLPINEDGEFDHPWPEGFFSERFRELF